MLSGTVNLYRQNHPDQPIDIVNKNALLNELALITEVSRPFTAIVQTHSTALKIDRSVFLRLINEFPEITRNIYDYVSERIRELASNINHLQDVQQDWSGFFNTPWRLEIDKITNPLKAFLKEIDCAVKF